MSLAALLSLAVLGLAVGFVAGLVGIGGGVLTVPFLYFFYSHPEFSGTAVVRQLQPAVAHATSLFIMVPTAVAGTLAYHRLHAVVWRAAVPVALCSTVGAVAGSRIAPLLRPEWLKAGFGAFLLVTAANLAFGKPTAAPGDVRVSPGAAALTGVLVGLLSALLGVGGGIVAIPLLLRLMHVRVEQVAATSLAIVAVAAASGAAAYMLHSPPAGGPRGGIGYVHVTAAIPILLAAALSVRWGARLNQRLDARRLRWGFAAGFALLGLQLVIRNLAAAWA